MKKKQELLNILSTARVELQEYKNSRTGSLLQNENFWFTWSVCCLMVPPLLISAIFLPFFPTLYRNPKLSKERADAANQAITQLEKLRGEVSGMKDEELTAEKSIEKLQGIKSIFEELSQKRISQDTKHGKTHLTPREAGASASMYGHPSFFQSRLARLCEDWIHRIQSLSSTSSSSNNEEQMQTAVATPL